MNNQSDMAITYQETAELIDEIERVIETIRKQNYHAIRIAVRNITPRIGEWMQVLNRKEDLLEHLQCTEINVQVMEILRQILGALEDEDYILVGDLYELLLIPCLLELQERIRQCERDIEFPNYFQKNMEVLQIQNRDLYVEMQRHEKAGIDTSMYLIEMTSVGVCTLALSDGDNRYYLHSNRNPLAEARIYVNRIYDSGKDNWLVVGWGMGYHIRELLHRDPYMNLVIYEPDSSILYCSWKMEDWQDILERVTIIQKEEELLDYLNKQYKLVIYRPELRHLTNGSIKKRLVEIADRQDSIEDHKEIFELDYRDNIKNCNGYIDELTSTIQGKKTIIVAGGPSLDKNIECLRNLSKETAIIAVGTVFKLLLSKGIRPDIVLFADVAAYPQIIGIEDEQIPVGILVTADRRIARTYKGSKYLICQQGYQQAAKYAEKMGYMCYDSGESVATLALDIAIRMKAKSIAFVGLDLAYDGKRAHATGTQYETFSGVKMQDVEGINGKILNTSRVFNQYREWLERRIQKKDVTMPIIDATEGGARKQGFEIMKLQEYLMM